LIFVFFVFFVLFVVSSPLAYDPARMVPRIDSHQHFWSIARRDYGWLTPDLRPLYRDFLPDDLTPLLRAAGIERTVVVQAAPTLAETRFLLATARRTDFVAGVVGWVDLAAASAADDLAALAADPLLRGIRPMLQDLSDTDWILQPTCAPGLRAAAQRGLRFDALIRPPHLPVLVRLLERHPDLRVVVDHGAKPNIAAGAFAPWAADVRALAQHDGVYCKLSGLVTEAAPGVTLDELRPYLDCLLECFGAGRLMWGSDWPVVTLASSYDAWWDMTQRYLAPLSATEREAILGGTAARFYGL
jgi:L-fuconolactonase